MRSALPFIDSPKVDICCLLRSLDTFSSYFTCTVPSLQVNAQRSRVFLPSEVLRFKLRSL